MKNKKHLIVIPARGGSKGIPKKNIKLMNGKPLIYYTIDVARSLCDDSDICVSTDDDEIIKVAEDYDLKVPFKRPLELATDTATTNDVLLHAVDFYEQQGKNYEVIVLLQPTSPLRQERHLKKAIALYDDSIDMIVSVKKSHSASVLCHEGENGYLKMTLNGKGKRRQDVLDYYEYNGAIYIINVNSLKKYSLGKLIKKKKYVMDEISSIDIDTPLDWIIAENIIEKNYK